MLSVCRLLCASWHEIANRVAFEFAGRGHSGGHWSAKRGQHNFPGGHKGRALRQTATPPNRLCFRIATPWASQRDRYKLLASGDPDWSREPWRSLKGDEGEEWLRPKDRPRQSSCRLCPPRSHSSRSSKSLRPSLDLSYTSLGTLAAGSGCDWPSEPAAERVRRERVVTWLLPSGQAI